MRAPRYRAILAIAAIFLGLCVITVVIMPRGVFWSADSSAKFLAVRSIRFEGGALRYDVPYLGRNLDPGLIAVPVGETYYDVRNGEIHISWPELFPLVVAPFYALFGWLGLFVVPIAGGAISIYLTGRIAEFIRPGTGWMAATLGILATPILIYSTLLWEHTPALALLLGALFLVLQYCEDSKTTKVGLAAAAVGFASAGLRTDANIFFVALMAAAFLLVSGRRRWSIPPVATLGFIVGASPASTLNWITNGKILAANTMKNAPPPSLAYLKEVGFGIFPHFFAGKVVPLTAAWLAIGGAVVLVASHYLLRGRLRIPCVTLGMAALTVGSALALIDVRTTHHNRIHGFLILSPLLILGLLARPKITNPRRGFNLVLLTSVLLCTINLVALTVSFPEGWASELNREWGPRYWLVLFPMLAILTAVNYDTLFESSQNIAEKAAVAIGALALLVTSIAFETTGLGVIYDSGIDLTSIRATLEQQGDTPLVTDFFLTSSLSPDQYFRRPSFYVPFTESRIFRAWFANAASGGLTKFDLATFSDVTKHPFLAQPVDGWSFVIDGMARDRDLRIGHIRAVRSGEQ